MASSRNNFPMRTIGVVALMAQVVCALIPVTPGEQTRRAITSARETISKIREQSTLPPRIYIDYLIPLPPATTDADIDPWPGGLAQMYPYAEETVREILAGVVDESSPDKCSTQILSSPDCCGLFIQESPISPELDVAAVVFPGADQLSTLNDIEKMVGNKRSLIIFNRQFTRPADFGFFKKGEAQETIFDKYQWGFAFQELACRGEDVKLTFEQSVGWQACIIDEKGNEIEMWDDEWDRMVRPDYLEMEKKINKILPEPLWLRMIGEAQEKGLKFQRKEE